MVDPSGHVPALPVQGIDSIPSRDDIRGALRKPFEAGLDFLNWYLSEPEACSCETGLTPIVGPYLALGPQAAWAYASEPAERFGVKITQHAVNKQVPKWWRRLPVIRSIPGKWGHKTIQVWQESHRSYGSLNRLQGPGMPRANGAYYSGSNSRYILRTKPRLKWGAKGVGGTIVLAGVIDGMFQFYADSTVPYYSPSQRANRAAASTVFGMVAGAAGAVAFGVTAAVTASFWAPIAVGFVIGTVAGTRLTNYKDALFNKYPKFFGKRCKTN